MNTRVALSFSGGKDSCLAVHQLQKNNIEIACLLTTIWEENQSTVAHGENLARIEDQANSLQLPVYFMKTDFESYGEDFVTSLKEMKKTYAIDGVAFGDMYLEGHREWGEDIAARVNLSAYYPLWTDKKNMLSLLKEFVDLGFRATVIKVDDTKLPADWVGRPVDASFIADISTYDVCPMGESGEYHTFVHDGPVFSRKVE